VFVRILHDILLHILTKITNLEGAFSNMNERVKKLDSSSWSED
jgi:hypothetical protein